MYVRYTTIPSRIFDNRRMVSVICQQVAPRAITVGVIRGRLYCAGRTSRRESVALFRRYVTRVVVGVNVRITFCSVVLTYKRA